MGNYHQAEINGIFSNVFIIIKNFFYSDSGFSLVLGKYSFLLLCYRYGMITKGIILALWNSQNYLRQRRIIIYKCQLKPSSEF